MKTLQEVKRDEQDLDIDDMCADASTVAWVPDKKVEHISIAGVLQLGGYVLADIDNISYSAATALAFKLGQETKICHGHYIPVYLD